MNPNPNNAFTSDPPIFLLKDLGVSVLGKSEHVYAVTLFKQEPYEFN